MRERGVGGLWDQFRDALPPPGPGVVTDGELLSRFVAARDEDAFRILVRRHGPMVWAVAQRILRDSHAAEDAFQATFLVLARHAKSIRQHETLTAWLHRVAVRIALRAKSTRRADAATLAEIPDKSTSIEEHELRGILDAAIERLPDKLRRTVVLCYLSGHTTEEAARVLECPKGTVLSRLSAARDKLKADLTRRGITISIGTLTAALAAESAPATVPSALVALTANLALPTAVVAPAILLLAKGAMAMTWTKITLATVSMLGVGTGIGIGMAGPRQVPSESTKANQPTVADNWIQDRELFRRKRSELNDRLNPKLGDTLPDRLAFTNYVPKIINSDETMLMVAKVEAAHREFELRSQEYSVGRGVLESLLDVAQRFVKAQLDLSPPFDEKVKILTQYRDYLDQLKSMQRARFQTGSLKQQDLERVTFAQIDAHLQLVRAQGKK